MTDYKLSKEEDLRTSLKSNKGVSLPFLDWFGGFGGQRLRCWCIDLWLQDPIWFHWLEIYKIIILKKEIKTVLLWPDKMRLTRNCALTQRVVRIYHSPGHWSTLFHFTEHVGNTQQSSHYCCSQNDCKLSIGTSPKVSLKQNYVTWTAAKVSTHNNNNTLKFRVCVIFRFFFFLKM